jgi:hypothetical protein
MSDPNPIFSYIPGRPSTPEPPDTINEATSFPFVPERTAPSTAMGPAVRSVVQDRCTHDVLLMRSRHIPYGDVSIVDDPRTDGTRTTREVTYNCGGHDRSYTTVFENGGYSTNTTSMSVSTNGASASVSVSGDWRHLCRCRQWCPFGCRCRCHLYTLYESGVIPFTAGANAAAIQEAIQEGIATGAITGANLQAAEATIQEAVESGALIVPTPVIPGSTTTSAAVASTTTTSGSTTSTTPTCSSCSSGMW